MAVLKDPIFQNRDVLESDGIKKYRIKSIEDINQDLVEFSAWDGTQMVATVALIITEGIIGQCIPNILGETDTKRVEARVIFGEEYRGEDHQIKIGKVEVQKFRFRGSLISDWLGPQDFNYTVQRPSTSQTGVWRDIEPARVESDGGQPLWLRAVLQPWTGLKLRLTVGVFATKDISKVQDAYHPRFPFINLMMTSITPMPFPPENLKVCLPFIPYLVDDSEEELDDLRVPKWTTIVRAVTGLFRENSAPHSKSNMGNLREALKGDWKLEKKSKYAYPEIELNEDVEEMENSRGNMWCIQIMSSNLCRAMYVS